MSFYLRTFLSKVEYAGSESASLAARVVFPKFCALKGCVPEKGVWLLLRRPRRPRGQALLALRKGLSLAAESDAAAA
eukprot:1904124-Pleurochrysis_carterae.AAC.1